MDSNYYSPIRKMRPLLAASWVYFYLPDKAKELAAESNS